MFWVARSCLLVPVLSASSVQSPGLSCLAGASQLLGSPLTPARCLASPRLQRGYVKLIPWIHLSPLTCQPFTSPSDRSLVILVSPRTSGLLVVPQPFNVTVFLLPSTSALVLAPSSVARSPGPSHPPLEPMSSRFYIGLHLVLLCIRWSTPRVGSESPSGLHLGSSIRLFQCGVFHHGLIHFPVHHQLLILLQSPLLPSTTVLSFTAQGCALQESVISEIC